MSSDIIARLSAFATLLLALASSCHAGDSISVLFYNTENFFDCRHDSLKDDNEFLPTSPRVWHQGRFKKKAINIAQVIVNSAKGSTPAVVGLCEVENDFVMKHLTEYSPLRQLGYKYVMTDSPDARGIDIAFLYQRELFKLLSHRSIRLDTKASGHPPTRDILHCCGIVASGDTIDFLLCHLPSRRGEASSAKRARQLAINTLKTYADSLSAVRLMPHIVIMGDFNCTPDDELLNCFSAGDSGNYEILTSPYAARTDIGSYKYKGLWQTLDNIIVNKQLRKPQSRLHTASARVVDDTYLLTEDEKYFGQKPFRTYNGMKYAGGYSDHLPILLQLHMDTDY